MTLLYLALAYMAGIALGQWAWSTGWTDCTWPAWLWWLPLALLLCTPALNALPWFQPRPILLRWPVSAGFEMPRHSPAPALLIAIGLCILTGILRYTSQPLEPCWTSADLAYYNLPADQAFNQSAPLATVIGYVSSYPLVADTNQRMEVTTSSVTIDAIKYVVQGKLRLNTGIRQRYVYGQPVRLMGRLVTPPEFEDFSYRDYLARKRIHSLLYSARIEKLPSPIQGDPLLRTLYAMRARGEDAINRMLPEPYAALANGMLLGIESGIPDSLYDKFNLTGASHVIVISGSNVALLVGVLMGMAKRPLARRRMLWPTLTGIACYALLVGGDAAVLRAAMMGGLYVVAIVIIRPNTALVSLAFACWMMTLTNPLALWDVGFQLSSAATAGLILFTPGLQALFLRLWNSGQVYSPRSARASVTDSPLLAAGNTLWNVLEQSLVTTLAASVMTLPLVVYYFHRLSLISIGTNLAIVLVQPLIILSGSTGVLLDLLGAEWLAQIIFWFTWLGLAWTVEAVEHAARLPWASLNIAGYGLGGLVLTYLLILGMRWQSTLIAWMARFTAVDIGTWQTKLVAPGAMAGVGVCALLVSAAIRSLPDGRLHVYFLDIGQGDGILIQTPSGRQVLIDGGASPTRLFGELGDVMPFWDRSLDLVVLTNPDSDHMAAQTEAPLRLHIATALETKASQGNPDAATWRANMASAGANIQVQHSGHWIDLGNSVVLEVLWPPPEPFLVGSNEQTFDNENSLVMKLIYGDFSVLFTGDAGLPSEMGLLAAGAPVQAAVLKVGHHGSRGSTSAMFLQAVNPQVAVIQVGAENNYGHPHAEVLDNLRGRTILRNDIHGRVHLYTDGQQLWLETENKATGLN